MPQYLAFDLGASGGRAVLGTLDGGRLHLEEIHRFPNGPVAVRGTLYTDILRLWCDVQEGIRAAQDADLAGVGVDTWGVDFGLLDARGALLGSPVHYRDARTDDAMDYVFQKVPRREVFEQTGIQFMQLNTLFQLAAQVKAEDPILAAADTLLLLPDLLNYWLTGRAASEFSIATTTQCYNPRTGTWAAPLLEALEIPTHLFTEIVPTGTVLGPLDVEGVAFPREVPVIATAGHDTASAVAAVPAQDAHFVYISSGTWSLMGAEVPQPIINDKCLAYNFTNEGGINNTIRLLKNISGLWLVQECRRVWAEAGDGYSYDELVMLAEHAPPFGSLIDPDASEFLPPGDMPARIRAFCKRTGQDEPADRGAVIRCALESLALRYRLTLNHLEDLLGWQASVIHIVGGGSKNALLCQLTADATGRAVVAGPDEATAIGNVMVQAMATGHLASLEEGRAIVAQSGALTRYAPDVAASDRWDEAYARFLEIVE